MASTQVLDRLVSTSRELRFAGDRVTLAGQIDYPVTPRPAQGYPLVFIVSSAGCNTRLETQPYADTALTAGYAVFRWDKRGTGRSGAGGRGSTTQDAIYAYQTALDQMHVNLRGAVILAHDSGTALLGSAFGLFAREQHPAGVILASNRLDETAILAIDTRVCILMSYSDWHPWQTYADAAATAHNRAYAHGAASYVARGADRMFTDVRDDRGEFHAGTRKVLIDWLQKVYPAPSLT